MFRQTLGSLFGARQMPDCYVIDMIDGITVVKFLREPDPEDIVRAINEVASDYPSQLRLWDISCGLALKGNDMRSLAAFAKSADLPAGSRIAVLAPADLAFGLSRMFEAFRSEDRVKQCVFRTQAEAMAWLKD